MYHFRLIFTASVAAVFLGCNLAHAEETSPEDHKAFTLGGYASAGGQLHPGGHAEAALNEFSLFFNWDGNGRLRLFSELEIERPLRWTSGTELTTEDAYFDVERLYADYNLSGSLNVRAGRFLMPMGRWNLIHAAPLVWTSLRPAATRQLFPLAINGVMLYGATPWGQDAIEYSAFVESVRDHTDDPGEIPFEKTRGFRLAYSGLMEAGVTFSQFREDVNGRPYYRMLGIDFFKSFGGFELSGELFQRFEQGDGANSGGGYVQGVVPLPDRWFAVGRLETLRTADEQSAGRWLAGLAWRFKPDQVFKVEYAGGRHEHPDMPRGLVASFAILF